MAFYIALILFWDIPDSTTYTTGRFYFFAHSVFFLCGLL